MAKVTDYGTLKTWLSTTGHRADLTADIPGFIQSAEGMIAAEVRALEFVTTATLQESDRSSGAIYNLPSNFLGAKAITGTQSSVGYALKQVSIGELYRYSLTGQPVVFSVYDKLIEFRASPATDTDFTLIYFAKPDAFSADGDTNSLLTSHPDIYQHSSMFWFHVHTQDLELASAHETAFHTAVVAVNALAEEIRGAATIANQYNYSSVGTM